MTFTDHIFTQADRCKEDVLGRSAIHHASLAGAVQALEYIIQEGEFVNKLARVGQATPLHYAAKVNSRRREREQRERERERERERWY